MENWQKFELDCFSYIEKNYSQNEILFVPSGQHDPTQPDIIVKRNGNTLFNIEVKSQVAQCGQFVLHPDFSNRCFVFSKRNKSSEEKAQKFIDYMNDKFEIFCDLKPTELQIQKEFMFDWVKYYYAEVKKTRYFMSEFNNEYVIFPLDKINEYMDIKCLYRIKKSGSTDLTHPNIGDFMDSLESNGISHFSELIQKDKSYFIKLNEERDKIKIQGKKKRYLLCKEGDLYQVRMLSNTTNANIIFTISTKIQQKLEDLQLFINDLS